MTKIICETTGDFQLVDFGNSNFIVRAFRPSVATHTPFLSQRAAAGQLTILATVSDEATDEEFERYLKDSDGDVQLAVSAFASNYSVELKKVAEEVSEEPAPQRGRKGRG